MTGAKYSSPFAVATPTALPSLTRICAIGGLRLDLDSELARRIGDGVGDRAGAAAGKAPGAEGAVDLAHVVVQQHVGGARRAHAEEGADDARGRHGGLEHVGLEPLVEKVDRAHGHQLHLVVLVLAAEVLEAAAEEEQLAAGRCGFRVVGSGGTMPRIGFTKRHICSMALPNSS